MKYCYSCHPPKEYLDTQRYCPVDGELLSLPDRYSLVGRTLRDKYQLRALVGSGAMGAVYKAFNQRIDRHVAVKILHPNMAFEKTLLDMFKDEARLTGQLKHDNIVEILDADTCPLHSPRGIVGELDYIVMEWLEGQTLGAALAGGRSLGVGRALGIIRQVAVALQAAHARRIVHRDLKPSNIMLVEGAPLPGKAAAGERVKVLDFGIGKMLETVEGATVAATVTSYMGTWPYMSPEQVQVGEGRIDRRSDIWAVGVILYEMLAGRRPFVAENPGVLTEKIQHAAPPTLSSLGVDVPRAVEEIIESALEKKPENRLQSAAELLEALDRCQGGRPPADTVSQEQFWQEVVIRVKPAVLHVEVSQGAGTGFLIGPGGYALTCYHVVENAESVNVRLIDGRRVSAAVLGGDRAADLALLRLAEVPEAAPLRLADAEQIQEGQSVMAIGHPLGFAFTVSRGIISNRSRVYGQVSYVQTDASLNPGNSGGPIINAAGELVGVANWVIRKDTQGLGFGIAIPHVRALLSRFRVPLDR